MLKDVKIAKAPAVALLASVFPRLRNRGWMLDYKYILY